MDKPFSFIGKNYYFKVYNCELPKQIGFLYCLSIIAAGIDNCSIMVDTILLKIEQKVYFFSMSIINSI